MNALAGPPQFMERRLVVRVLSDWRERAGGRDVPSWQDVAGSVLLDTWSHCAVIELARHGRHRLHHVGTALLPSPSDTPLKWLDDVLPGSLLARAVRGVDLVAERAVPVLQGEALKAADGYRLYRGVLLPLGERGSITHILAAASARQAEAAPDHTLGGETLALYGRRYGDWRLDSLIDDLDLARFEAERLVMSERYDTVRVVIESGPALGSPEAHRTVFTAGGEQPGSDPTARGRKRSSALSGRVVVSALALGVVLLAGIYAAAGNLH